MHNTKVLFAVLVAVSVSIAQSVNISRKVTNTGTTPIVGEIVNLEKGGQTITTGANGTFSLTGASHRAFAQWVTQNSTTTDTLSQVYFIDASTGYACGATWSSIILLKTDDGGTTWNKQNFNGVPFSVFFTDANNGYISGQDTIYKTVNAGSTWTKYPLGLGSTFAGLTVYFYNATVGYVSGTDYITNTTKIFHTTNAGVSWIASSSGGTTATSGSNCLFCTSADTCYVVGFNGGSPGMSKTTDGGVTWNNIFKPIERDLISVYFTSTTTGFAAGGCNDTKNIYRTTDGGSTWNEVYTTSGSYINSLCFTSATTGYAVGGSDGGGNTVLQTTDGGTTWNPMATPTNKPLACVHFPTANTGYAVGAAGTIIKYDLGIGIIEEANKVNGALVFHKIKNGVFQITNSQLRITSMGIYNVLGKKVCATTNFKRDISNIIDISSSPKGIYIVKIYAGNNIYTAKIMLQ